MRTSDRTKWAACFGLMGSLMIAGVATAMKPRMAEASEARADDAARGAQQTPRPTPDGNAQANGALVYRRACGRCHPNGNEDIGPAIRGKNLSEQVMLNQRIRSGYKTMRAIPPTKLPDSDVPPLMTFLRSIQAVR